MNNNDLALSQNALSVWKMIKDKINGEDDDDAEYWDDDETRVQDYVDVD